MNKFFVICIILLAVTLFISILKDSNGNMSGWKLRRYSVIIITILFLLSTWLSVDDVFRTATVEAEESYEEEVIEETEMVVFEVNRSEVDPADQGCEAVNRELITVEASSMLGTSKYSPEKLIDGDETTSWQEGVDGLGIGETITFYFEEPQSLVFVYIRNGSGVSEEKYYQNGRVYRMSVINPDTGESCEFDLSDISDQKEGFELMGDGFMNVNSLVFTITDVYPGDLYEDTVISEFTFYTR